MINKITGNNEETNQLENVIVTVEIFGLSKSRLDIGPFNLTTKIIIEK